VLEELEPRWILVVGIAGGVPSDELTLGDVVVSNRIVDFSVEAVLQDRAPEFALMGGPVAKEAAVILADLRALAGEPRPAGGAHGADRHRGRRRLE
jgi:nucleoside phosphorylase